MGNKAAHEIEFKGNGYGDEATCLKYLHSIMLWVYNELTGKQVEDQFEVGRIQQKTVIDLNERIKTIEKASINKERQWLCDKVDTIYGHFEQNEFQHDGTSEFFTIEQVKALFYEFKNRYNALALEYEGEKIVTGKKQLEIDVLKNRLYAQAKTAKTKAELLEQSQLRHQKEVKKLGRTKKAYKYLSAGLFVATLILGTIHVTNKDHYEKLSQLQQENEQLKLGIITMNGSVSGDGGLTGDGMGVVSEPTAQPDSSAANNSAEDQASGEASNPASSPASDSAGEGENEPAFGEPTVEPDGTQTVAPAITQAVNPTVAPTDAPTSSLAENTGGNTLLEQMKDYQTDQASKPKKLSEIPGINSKLEAVLQQAKKEQDKFSSLTEKYRYLGDAELNVQYGYGNFRKTPIYEVLYTDISKFIYRKYDWRTTTEYIMSMAIDPSILSSKLSYHSTVEDVISLLGDNYKKGAYHFTSSGEFSLLNNEMEDSCYHLLYELEDYNIEFYIATEQGSLVDYVYVTERYGK